LRWQERQVTRLAAPPRPPVSVQNVSGANDDGTGLASPDGMAILR